MPMKELTKGNKLAVNTAALGATLQLLGIESEPLETVISRQFKKKATRSSLECGHRSCRLRLRGSKFYSLFLESAARRQTARNNYRQPSQRHGWGGCRREVLRGVSDEPIHRRVDVDGGARA
jgi:hypothetical protein